MKKVMNYLMQRRSVVSAFMFVAGITSVIARWGCCFYIYHQPKFPDALKIMD